MSKQKNEAFLKRALKAAVSPRAPWYVRVARTALLGLAGYGALLCGLMHAPGRSLTAGESGRLRDVFSGAVDAGDVTVHSSAFSDGMMRLFFGGRGARVLGYTHGSTIFIDGEYNRADYAAPGVSAEATMVFLHEAVHVWQYQNCKAASLLQAHRDSLRNSFSGVSEVYGYELKPGRDLLDYSVEQQATIITDWYLHVRGGGRTVFAVNAGGAGEEQRQLYTETLRNFEKDPGYIARRCHKL